MTPARSSCRSWYLLCTGVQNVPQKEDEMSDQPLMPSAQQGARIIFSSSGLLMPILGRRGDLILVLVLKGHATIPVQYLLDRDDIEVKGWLSTSQAEAEKDPFAIRMMDSRFELAISLTREEFDSEIEKMVKALFS